MSLQVPSQRAAYADLFERMLDPTFLLEPSNQTILELNPAAERLLEGSGFAAQAGKSLADLVAEPLRDEFGKALRVAMRRHHPRQFESQWVLAGANGDQKMLVMDVFACPMKLND